MITRSTLLVAIVMTVVSACCESSAEAQVPRLQVRQRTYNVTIISNFGVPVRVGIFGYANDATFRLDFDGGRTGPDVYTQELIGGERVVFVWDQQRRPLLVAQVRIDANGVLELAPMFGAAAARQGGAAPARQGAAAGAAEDGGFGLPQLKIKPKN